MDYNSDRLPSFLGTYIGSVTEHVELVAVLLVIILYINKSSKERNSVVSQTDGAKSLVSNVLKRHCLQVF